MLFLLTLQSRSVFFTASPNAPYSLMKKEAAAKWKDCLDLIRQALNNDAAFAAWFQPVQAESIEGKKLTLKLPSQLYAQMYETEYLKLLNKAILKVLGRGFSVDFIYPKPKSAEKEGARKAEKKAAPTRAEKKPKLEVPEHREVNAEAYMPKLNADLSFENYCVGSSNKLPWTIAESIARQPVNSTFNPFFLYGDVGVGKTHLMQAIGLKVKEAFPDKMVVFLPMKEFQRLYQNAYLQKEIPAFLQWFMRCDVLLFDDLQEVISSEGTLNNALFPIFNHLHQHGKQLVFTCDRPPHELKGVQKRLIDRFKWGITEKLERPDAALRKKILTFKAKKNGLDLPQNVIDYIAKSPITSVREIEGVVLGVMTRAISLGRDIDVALAKEVLANAVKPIKKKAINFEMIVEGVADKFNLNSDVLFSKSRVKDVAEARMMVMYLGGKLLGLSTGAIGRNLGRKHSTVIHGIKTVKDRLEGDSEFKDSLLEIEKNLQGV